jgi:hypothetical protein
VKAATSAQIRSSDKKTSGHTTEGPRPDAINNINLKEDVMKELGLGTQKILRGNASEFHVAGELSRRGIIAMVTLGNCPTTDILCSNTEGTKFVHIQVKTFKPGSPTCSVGKKAEINYGRNFFWVLAGIPYPEKGGDFTYYVIPSKHMSKNIEENHRIWGNKKGKNGRPHDKSTTIRTAPLPPKKGTNGWNIKRYENKWELIQNMLG